MVGAECFLLGLRQVVANEGNVEGREAIDGPIVVKGADGVVGAFGEAVKAVVAVVFGGDADLLIVGNGENLDPRHWFSRFGQDISIDDAQPPGTDAIVGGHVNTDVAVVVAARSFGNGVDPEQVLAQVTTVQVELGFSGLGDEACLGSSFLTVKCVSDGGLRTQRRWPTDEV